jgi:hypothetical protein
MHDIIRTVCKPGVSVRMQLHQVREDDLKQPRAHMLLGLITNVHAYLAKLPDLIL